ncbi:MAG TPA: DUF262 domain-containing protein [Verrucomicrobiae bacterium]
MKAEALPLLKFLRSSPQLTIPIYQRTYSWSLQNCEQLWNDILRVGSLPQVNAHFIGSIVYVEADLQTVGNPSALLIIDGQQRVTTATILLEALARTIGEEEPEDGFTARKIRNYYLLDPEETGERRHKLILTQTDKTTMLALTGQQPIPDAKSIRVMENFEYFTRQIGGLDGKGLRNLCRGLAKLMIVEVALQRGQDNPQLIFESMNSTGLALSQADLIRNFVLMGQIPHEQTRLYQSYWRPIEERFGQEAYRQAFDGFMRHYLTLKTRKIPRISAVYNEFKAYLAEQAAGVEQVLADIYAHAGHYAAMALGQEKDPALAAAFADLGELKVDVAYPLLLELYHDYSKGQLSRVDMLSSVRLIENFVLRRAVCGVPTNVLNKTFAAFAQNLVKDNYLDAIQARFTSLSGRARFPDDAEFRHALCRNHLYSLRPLRFILKRFENYDRKEPVSIEGLTIEHILPQNKVLKPEWIAALGPDWQTVQDKWLHTLGNLTLTGYNSEYRDHPFLTKRDLPGGFAQSPLRLNQGLGQLETWNEETIVQRGERLADTALEVWPMPNPQQVDTDTMPDLDEEEEDTDDENNGG